MRLGHLPQIGWKEIKELQSASIATDDPAASATTPVTAAGVNKWGPNLQHLPLLSDNKTLAQAVAATADAARSGGGGGSGTGTTIRPADVILKGPNGKPLRAGVIQDAWPLGMILYELFVNEPFFAGCSDDVALQVLTTCYLLFATRYSLLATLY